MVIPLVAKDLETVLSISSYDQTRLDFLQGCTFEGTLLALTALRKRGFNISSLSNVLPCV